MTLWMRPERRGRGWKERSNLNEDGSNLGLRGGKRNRATDLPTTNARGLSKEKSRATFNVHIFMVARAYSYWLSYSSSPSPQSGRTRKSSDTSISAPRHKLISFLESTPSSHFCRNPCPISHCPITSIQGQNLHAQEPADSHSLHILCLHILRV